MHLNAQSLLNKIDEFRHLFITSCGHIICITETWFQNEMNDSIVSLEGYDLYRADRIKHAGGSAIYVKKNLNSNVLQKSESDDTMEYLSIRITN